MRRKKKAVITIECPGHPGLHEVHIVQGDTHVTVRSAYVDEPVADVLARAQDLLALL